MASKKDKKIKWPELPKHECQEVGRRKTSSARVRLYKAGKEKKKDLVNGKLVEQWCPIPEKREKLEKPFEVTGLKGEYWYTALVTGGGINGQVDAIVLGIARCLANVSEDARVDLAKAGLLTRDPREVERKKIFRYKARRAPQWSKR